MRTLIAILGAAWFIAVGAIPASAAMPLALAKAYAADIEQPTCVNDIAQSGEEHSYTLTSGQQVFTVRASCGCGASNCRYGVYVPDGEGYRSQLLLIAQKIDLTTDGKLVSTGEGDAWLSERQTYQWNGTKYALSSDLVVYKGKTTKPASTTVKFAAGASSATVSGTQIANHFPDTYDLGASKGQTMDLTFLKSNKVGSVFLSSMTPTQVVVSTTHTGDTYSAVLPADGAYMIEVYGVDDDSFGSYAMTIAIH